MRVVFLDRDGVLNHKAVDVRYVRNWQEFQWIPGAVQAIVELKRAGYFVVIISNQAGVGRGHMSETDLNDIHQHMQDDLLQRGVQIDRFYCCLHAPDADCDCRKPKPGLLLQAQKDFGIDFNQAVFIGDDAKDGEAGAAVGCRTILLSPGKTLLNCVQADIFKNGVAA